MRGSGWIQKLSPFSNLARIACRRFESVLTRRNVKKPDWLSSGSILSRCGREITSGFAPKTSSAIFASLATTQPCR